MMEPPMEYQDLWKIKQIVTMHNLQFSSFLFEHSAHRTKHSSSKRWQFFESQFQSIQTIKYFGFISTKFNK